MRDTCNLLADGIVKLLRALAAVEGSDVKGWAKAQGYERYLEIWRESGVGRVSGYTWGHQA